MDELDSEWESLVVGLPSSSDLYDETLVDAGEILKRFTEDRYAAFAPNPLLVRQNGFHVQQPSAIWGLLAPLEKNGSIENYLGIQYFENNVETRSAKACRPKAVTGGLPEDVGRLFVHVVAIGNRVGWGAKGNPLQWATPELLAQQLVDEFAGSIGSVEELKAAMPKEEDYESMGLKFSSVGTEVVGTTLKLRGLTL